MAFSVRGIVLVFTNERSLPVADTAAAAFLGRGQILFINNPILIFIILTIICWYISKYTKYGRYNFAIGGNEEAARYMGLPVDKTKIWIFTMSGTLAAIGRVVLTSRLGTAQPMAGVLWDMQALAAVVVGGTLLTGGVGSFVGTYIGTMTMGIVLNLINLQGNLSSYVQSVVRGSFLLLVVVLQSVIIIYRKRNSIDV